MNVIKPYMRIMNPHAGLTTKHYVADLLKHVDWCGRVSHRSEDAPSDTERFLRHVVLEKGDWSIVEHSQLSVDAVVDRGITHEIVRHRIAAYTQESTRFVNYVKKMPPSFIYPIVDAEPPYDPDWIAAIDEAETRYKALLAKGWKPQDARSVFPNALASRIIITYNLRTWRHFFQMRTSAQAHPQMRQVTIPLLAEFQRLIPVLYEDIQPNAVQITNMRLGR